MIELALACGHRRVELAGDAGEENESTDVDLGQAPGMCPTMERERVISRSVMPPIVMRFAASRKKGRRAG
jgi:hypothetical protein